MLAWLFQLFKMEFIHFLSSNPLVCFSPNAIATYEVGSILLTFWMEFIHFHLSSERNQSQEAYANGKTSNKKAAAFQVLVRY